MAKKKSYRIRNWSEYSKALVNRGSITVWFDPETVSAWHSIEVIKKRGRPQVYSDLAIECCLTLKALFHLPLRATQGLVDSLLCLMQVPLCSPNYSLLSLRQEKLKLTIPTAKSKKEAMHLVVDATGLKLYGEGEWKVKKHGKEKRRTWLKLHLGVDANDHMIEACMLTGDDVHDNEALPYLLEQADGDLEQVTADGAYDSHEAYLLTANKKAIPCFPPRKNAVRHKATDEGWRLRNHAVSYVGYHGLKKWKKKNNYHQRSLAETAMFRFKQLFGDKVQARKMSRQAVEIGIKCLAMNKITSLGMPAY